MAENALKIAWIGGGSRFVVTFLHGLAAEAAKLKALDKPIELALVDPNPDAAGAMARYTEITAETTGLPLTPTVTADTAAALDGADLVIFCAGIWEPITKARERFLPEGLHGHGEHGAGVAVEAAALWPFLKGLAEDMKRLCPRAVFASVVNPTDVIAAAVEKASGIRSIGVCVEIGGLRGFLCYYLGVAESQLDLQYIGVNHTGWVIDWTIDGKPGAERFWQEIPKRRDQADWYPHPAFFLDLYAKTGFMRTSPYHNWPYPTDKWTDERQAQNDRWAKTCLPAGKDRHTHRREMLEAALAEGRMIAEIDERKVHPEATPYTYPNSRWTFGALAVGLAGGQAGPVPLQIRNGQSNACADADAWLEIPATIEAGQMIPQTVPAPPEWLWTDTNALAIQRARIADWLAGVDEQGLAAGLLARPERHSVETMVEIIDHLAEFRDA